jgi:hypothetical protein
VKVDEMGRVARVNVPKGASSESDHNRLPDFHNVRMKRLRMLADILAQTPAAAVAKRIAEEYDDAYKPSGRLKKLKRLAKDHGLWVPELGL